MFKINKVYIYDAFTNKNFHGNQAAIVLNSDNFSHENMQSIAKEFGYSETVFLSKSNITQFRVHFFTPIAEVDMCGHATIAFTQTLIDNNLILIKDGLNTLNIETNLGVIAIYIFKENEFINIFMEQDTPKLETTNIESLKVLEAMGLPLDALNNNFPILKGYTGLWDLLIPLNSIKHLESINMNKDLMIQLSKKHNFISFHPFVLLGNNQVRVRNFAPICGIDEESATGTSNGALSFFLYKENSLKIDTTLSVSQGKEMGRESEIKAKIISNKDGNIRVVVGGNAVKFLEGTI
ncbi:MAG: PhzF family phenazine biosynthesis protein [Fusobacteriaceae bacterium]